MDLTIETDTENQQQIQLKLIHDTTRVSTLKEYLQLMSASSKPKTIRSGSFPNLRYQ